jgi:hypothetical protein
MTSDQQPNYEKLNDFLNSKLPSDALFEIPPVTEDFVLKELLNLKDGKAVGLDGIGPKLLRLGATALATPLTRILNLSLSSGIFPDEWKTAKVVPIHKKGSLQDRGNFRPVSILSTLSKLLERHVHLAFYDYLKGFNLLHMAQSGFRNLFSCESALLNIVNKWTTAIDNDDMNGVILLDLRKAFDLIDHDILLQKLKLYKCSELTIKWFNSYLKGRTQCTYYNGKLSEKLPIKTGVPQGSILGPLLFIMFINDLPLALDDSDTDMYADDSTVTAQGKTTIELEEKLSADAEKITEWCSENHMAPNATKTKVMLITTRQKRASLDVNERQLKVKMNGKYLENVTSEKLLGAIINNNLSWEEHINKVVSRVNSKLALLRKIKGCLPLAARKMFSNAHILPHMDYCSTVWGDSPHVENLFLSQKRVARTILDVKGKAISEPENRTHLLLSKLNWMSIKDRINFRKATMVYKSLNNLTPQYMSNMFKYVLKSQNTRQCKRSSQRNDLVVPPGRHKVIFETSFGFSATVLWNSISPNIRNCTSLNGFKSAYLREFFKDR